MRACSRIGKVWLNVLAVGTAVTEDTAAQSASKATNEKPILKRILQCTRKVPGEHLFCNDFIRTRQRRKNFNTYFKPAYASLGYSTPQSLVRLPAAYMLPGVLQVHTPCPREPLFRH